MLSNPTTFIIGAGASFEVDMPLARTLGESIAQSSATTLHHGETYLVDEELDQLLGQRFHGKPEARKARVAALKRISEGLLPRSSIDAFIHQHAHDPLIAEMGKLQIARHIVKAEAKSRLFVQRYPNTSVAVREKLQGTWYEAFAAALFNGLKRSELDKLGHNLSIVCFNYDRCLEVALMESLRAVYGIDYIKAFELVGNLNIWHPYGTLGHLSAAPQLGDGVGFGDVHADPWMMSESLQTFTEGIGARSRQEEVRGAIANAEALVFLGFSFQPINMEFLKTSVIKFNKQVFSTGVGIKPQGVPEVRKRIGALYGLSSGQVEFNSSRWHIEVGETCSQLFDTHALSFG